MVASPDKPSSDDGIRVLMIEDDDKLARLTARYLENHGLVVVRAPDGPTGVGAMSRGTFDVVLLDLMLPGMGGIDVCREIRSRSDVPVIMLTARGEEAAALAPRAVGPYDVTFVVCHLRWLSVQRDTQSPVVKSHTGVLPAQAAVAPVVHWTQR